MKLEYYIKQLTRSKKLSIISNPYLFINELGNKNNYRVGIKMN